MQYVSQAYFRAVRKAMVEAGFASISQVTISSDDVPCQAGRKARSTTLFFHAIGRGLIVQLEYTEFLEAEADCLGSGAYWSIDFYLEFRPVEELVRMAHAKLGEKYWEVDPYEGIPVLYETVALPDFSDYGGSSDSCGRVAIKLEETKGRSQDSMPVSRLIHNVRALTDPVMPYVLQGKMAELQVTCFPPYYIFKGCEKIFWGRFDLQYLKQAVVRRPWGSDMRQG